MGAVNQGSDTNSSRTWGHDLNFIRLVHVRSFRTLIAWKPGKTARWTMTLSARYEGMVLCFGILGVVIGLFGVPNALSSLLTVQSCFFATTGTMRDFATSLLS